MRTVIYYAPERIALNRSIRLEGGHWNENNGTRRNYYPGCYESRWLKGETGVMVLEQSDLNLLVSAGLVVLGDVCEP